MYKSGRQRYQKKKARLCACGNELRGKIADLFSPTIRALTYSTVHQIAVIDRMKVLLTKIITATPFRSKAARLLGREGK